MGTRNVVVPHSSVLNDVNLYLSPIINITRHIIIIMACGIA